MRNLELLAPAKNKEIGIAAIDCGADAVYIAGPGFGARQAAGNSIEDIRELCSYAHSFGARVFITINTIIFDNELPQVKELLENAEKAGVDAVIDQDLALLDMRTARSMPLHASTQCAIRTPDKSAFYESLGFSRLVLERELSLEDIRKIRSAVDCELEFFVHGALCVCYSGQCYMSEHINGRSANRGECIQACRSLYNLEDSNGKTLVKNKALLSLKDYNLINRLEDLADAGIDSFKIEGRLKGISYVRNVVRAYSLALDRLVEKHPESYRRASFGRAEGGFVPDLDKTFNRRYTELFMDGKRGEWSSMNAPKSIGEEIGTVLEVRKIRNGGSQNEIAVKVRFKDLSLQLHNGDGFAFLNGNEIVGFRGDVCIQNEIRCKSVPGLKADTVLFRNVDSAFEHETETNTPSRTLGVSVDISFSADASTMNIAAETEDGRKIILTKTLDSDKAKDKERMAAVFRNQISKVSGIYSFTLRSLEGETLPFMPASAINGIRRSIAAELDRMPCKTVPMFISPRTWKDAAADKKGSPGNMPLTYKDNVSNHSARKIYEALSAESIEPAFELHHRKDAELMRTKYCIRHELGLCPKQNPDCHKGPLFLVNNGKRYALSFDCTACEMTVKAVCESQAAHHKPQNDS